MTTQTTCRDCQGELTGIDLFRCETCAMAYRVALRTTAGVFKARFQGTCADCGKAIAKGDNAIYGSGRQVVHFGCYHRASRSARCPQYDPEQGCPLHGEVCA